MFSKERRARGQAELRAKKLKLKYAKRKRGRNSGRIHEWCYWCEQRSARPVKTPGTHNRLVCTNPDCLRRFRKDPGKLAKDRLKAKPEENAFGMRDDIFAVYKAQLQRKFYSRFRRAAN